jgi:hypothetical protein
VQYDQVDPFMYQRSSYYGNYATPVVAGDGRSKPSAWSVSDMEADLAAHAATTSPLRMKVTETGLGEFVVSIAADESVDDARFVAVAVLAEDVPSSSGTSFLPFHAKVFLTPYLGTALSMSAGDSLEFPFSFTVEPEWDCAEMGVAAWVQADGGENPSHASDLPIVHGALQAAFAPSELTGVTGGQDAPVALGAPMPNPTRGHVRFGLDVLEPARVRLAVYDVSGRLVATILDERVGPGPLNVVWDGRDASGRKCSSGVYFARLTNGRGVCGTRRLALLR